MKDYEIIKYFTMVCGANNNDACTALKLYREVENEKEKSCAIWKRLIKGIYTPYICDMVVKFCAQKESFIGRWRRKSYLPYLMETKTYIQI